MAIQQRLERLALSSWSDDACPDPDLLAAYILGTLAGTDQLVVSAHVRGCPVCQQDVIDCRPPELRPRLRIARLFSPLAIEGRRSTVSADRVRHYVSADLTAELTITLQEGEAWRMSGQIRRSDVGVSSCAVVLRRARGRPMEVQADDQGFFTFANLRAGRYTLTVIDDAVQVQIRAITLESEEL